MGRERPAESVTYLAIFLGSFRLPYEEIRDIVLEVDEDRLSESLIQFLQMCTNEHYNLEKTDDKQMSSVKLLRPRLNGILFKLTFEEQVNNIRPDIMNVTFACEEVKKSDSFSKLLEMVLLVGNYMNAGSRNAQTFGFNISFLCKLRDTKSISQNTTLLHFLADKCEENYPEILRFPDELEHVDNASKVSAEILKSSLTTMERHIQRLENDIENFPKTDDPQDNQKSIVEGKHHTSSAVLQLYVDNEEHAREQYEKLSTMHKNMQKLYESIGSYFAFDPHSVSVEDFFGELANFRILFMGYFFHLKNARQFAGMGKLKLYSTVEEQDPDKGDETGVMDSLMEALQSGAAFRDRRKRTPRNDEFLPVTQGMGVGRKAIDRKEWKEVREERKRGMHDGIRLSESCTPPVYTVSTLRESSSETLMLIDPSEEVWTQLPRLTLLPPSLCSKIEKDRKKERGRGREERNNFGRYRAPLNYSVAVLSNEQYQGLTPCGSES
ncbi:hypothetical protein INR49_013495 [Caranx melampygus]|nr:hypothetical protein INR49_013495 [Caranx melampygus]